MTSGLIVGIQKRIWLVSLTFFVAMAVTVVNLTRQVPVYRAVAIVELPLPQKDESNVQFQTRIATRLATATASDVTTAAHKALGETAEEIGPRIAAMTTRGIQGSSLVTLTVDALDPMLGAEFANAWAAAFIDSLPETEKLGARLADRAIPAPAPMSPRKRRTIFLASGAGLALGLFLAGALTIMEHKE